MRSQIPPTNKPVPTTASITTLSKPPTMSTHEAPTPTTEPIVSNPPANNQNKETEYTQMTNNTNPDAEMFNTRGKNLLSRTRGESPSEDSQPARKKATPNSPDD